MDLFPSPCDSGLVTAYEEASVMVSCSSEEMQNFESSETLKSYPTISRTPLGGLQHSLSRDELKSVFVSAPKGILRQFIQLWLNRGTSAVLKSILMNAPFGRKFTEFCSKICRSTSELAVKLLNFESSPYEFLEILDWESNWIRALAWHKHGKRIAVCLQNDYIRVYSLAAESPNDRSSSVTLRHCLQHKVVALEWKPCSFGCLAVACETNILIWWLDPSSLATRPSPNCAQVVCPPSASCPIAQITWNSSGTALLSASASTSDILFWDVLNGTYTPISGGCGGIIRLSFSPNGSKLFTSSTSQSLRVWNSSFEYETWKNLKGKCTAATWGPDGRTLLFSTTESFLIYAIELHGINESSGMNNKNLNSASVRSVYGSNTAYPIFDCSQVALKTEGGHPVTVGGRIHQIKCSQDGRRIVVAFRDNPEFVAVFGIAWTPNVLLTPCGLIRGAKMNHAESIAFQPGFSAGSLLTVVWSSGKVQFLPMFYKNTLVGNHQKRGYGKGFLSLSKDSFSEHEYSSLIP